MAEGPIYCESEKKEATLSMRKKKMP